MSEKLNFTLYQKVKFKDKIFNVERSGIIIDAKLTHGDYYTQDYITYLVQIDVPRGSHTKWVYEKELESYEISK